MADSRIPDVLKCFDANLNIRRELFDDSISICDIEVESAPFVPVGLAATLQFGEQVIDLSKVLDWISSFAECGGWTFYLHHHDNIVTEFELIEPYEQGDFRRCLLLFRTRSADEGGSNLLGVISPGRTWIFVIENDNQGGFRIDFFGSFEVCRDLRSSLGTPFHGGDINDRDLC